MNEEQFEKVRDRAGFIAALDQSGGSTPKALQHYGIAPDVYGDDEAKMFDLMHEMRSRIMASTSFDGDRILGAILFEMTMDRSVDGAPTGAYLWDRKRVVPFLKVDKGLAEEDDGAQVMKPIPDLDDLCSRAREAGMFGTKMRSVIKVAGAGVGAVVAQQFDVARRILDADLVPIVEPEVDIHSPSKSEAEDQLADAIASELESLPDGRVVMLKLTIPTVHDRYADLIAHPRVLRVVALSGGYSRDDACERLSRNHGMTASFSRALTEGLTAQQTDEEFDAQLEASIGQIFEASST